MKNDKLIVLNFIFLSIAIIALAFGMNVQGQRIAELEKAVQQYEERQQALISRDKALQIELSDLKKHVQEQKGGAGG
ncbi:hypothetical protein ACVRZE_09780 [Streptococcus henryi]